MTRLKELRQAKGLSQTEMAQLLGMSTQNYINYDRGNYQKCKKEIEKKISDILGVEFEYNTK